MPAYFIPPTAPLVPMVGAKRNPAGDPLFRHYRPMDAGINVYLMPGGVLTTVEPERESDAVRVFHGGHIHPVDDATSGLLVAAGYTVVELPAAVQDGPLPGFDDSELDPNLGVTPGFTTTGVGVTSLGTSFLGGQ